MSGNKCCYYSCGKSQRIYPDLSLFKFPKDPVLFQKWKKLCGNSLVDVRNPILCSDHFQDEMFTKNVKPRLIRNALPKQCAMDPTSPGLMKECADGGERSKGALITQEGDQADSSENDSDDSAEIPLSQLRAMQKASHVQVTEIKLETENESVIAAEPNDTSKKQPKWSIIVEFCEAQCPSSKPLHKPNKYDNRVANTSESNSSLSRKLHKNCNSTSPISIPTVCAESISGCSIDFNAEKSDSDSKKKTKKCKSNLQSTDVNDSHILFSHPELLYSNGSTCNGYETQKRNNSDIRVLNDSNIAGLPPDIQNHCSKNVEHATPDYLVNSNQFDSQPHLNVNASLNNVHANLLDSFCDKIQTSSVDQSHSNFETQFNSQYLIIKPECTSNQQRSTSDFYLIMFDSEQDGCEACSKAIKIDRFLKTTDGAVLYGCDKCPAYFLSPEDLINHKIEVHVTIEYSCRLCKIITGTSVDLLEHFKIHPSVKVKRCARCSSADKIPRSKRDIRYKLSRTAKPSTCIYCNAVFKSQNKLYWHVKSHRGERNHVCPLCGKQFAKLSHLDRHTRVHSNEKKSVCPYCNTSFSRHLNRHIELEHPDKMCKCPFCDKSFADPNSMNAHVRAGHRGIMETLNSIKDESDSGDDLAEPAVAEDETESAHEDMEQNDPPVKVDSGNTQKITQLLKRKLSKKSRRILRKGRKVRHWKALKLQTEFSKDANSEKCEIDPYSCDNCGKIYAKKDHLRIHMYNHFKPLECPLCGQMFAFKTYLRNHIASHTGEKRFLCHLCGSSFTQYGNLQSHIKRHTGNKRFQCSDCPKSFYLRGALKKHVRTHTGEQPFQCPYCNKSFSSSGNMVRHRMIHTGEKPYKCTYCVKAFIQSTELKNHLRTHTGEPRPNRPVGNKKFTCSQCGKMFTTAAYLKAHIRVHTGERPYKCEVCEKTFAKISSFSQHRKIHLTVKPYICNYCGKGFSQSGNFNMHLRRHTGEKPYKCDTCGKCFSQPVNLTRHQSVHTGEKRFICNHCGKKFSQSHALADHINVHTGAKPHKCVYCESAFANQSTLSRHLATHNHTGIPVLPKIRAFTESTHISSDDYKPLPMEIDIVDSDLHLEVKPSNELLQFKSLY